MTYIIRSSLTVMFVIATILPTTIFGAPTGSTFGYEALNGPSKWASLAPANAICDTGRQQSPVDFASQDASLNAFPLDFTLPSLTRFNITNKKHSVEFTPFDEGASTPRGMTVAGERFDLQQFHIHTPSEHRIDNMPFAAEVHFVHQSASGKISVVGMFINETTVDNPVWTSVLQNLPTTPDTTVTLSSIFETSGIVQATKGGVFSYNGSLTTPPCTEGVRWFVANTPMSMSPAQLQTIVRLIGFSARPTMFNVNVASSARGDPRLQLLAPQNPVAPLTPGISVTPGVVVTPGVIVTPKPPASALPLTPGSPSAPGLPLRVLPSTTGIPATTDAAGTEIPVPTATEPSPPAEPSGIEATSNTNTPGSPGSGGASPPPASGEASPPPASSEASPPPASSEASPPPASGEASPPPPGSPASSEASPPPPGSPASSEASPPPPGNPPAGGAEEPSAPGNPGDDDDDDDEPGVSAVPNEAVGAEKVDGGVAPTPDLQSRGALGVSSVPASESNASEIVFQSAACGNARPITALVMFISAVLATLL